MSRELRRFLAEHGDKVGDLREYMEVIMEMGDVSSELESMWTDLIRLLKDTGAKGYFEITSVTREDVETQLKLPEGTLKDVPDCEMERLADKMSNGYTECNLFWNQIDDLAPTYLTIPEPEPSDEFVKDYIVDILCEVGDLYGFVKQTGCMDQLEKYYADSIADAWKELRAQEKAEAEAEAMEDNDDT